MNVEIRTEDPQFPEKEEHKWDFRCSAEQKNVPTGDNFFKLSIFFCDSVLMLFLPRSQIHEGTISLRFLGIIVRVLRLEVSVDFLNHEEGGMVFYQVFLLSPFQHCNPFCLN
jgi:hypothetical protein